MISRATIPCLLLLGAFAAPQIVTAQPQTEPRVDKPAPQIERAETPKVTRPAKPQVEKPDTPVARQTEPLDDEERWRREDAARPVVRVGSDYALAAGDEAREVTVISGNATIAGHVYRDVVVVLGTAEIASTAVIDRSLTVVGGSTIIRPGATVGRDLVVVGGSLDAPAGFKSGGEHVVIGSQSLGGRIETFLPWITRGLLWGRLIVPDVAWVWWVVAFFFFFYFVINLLAERPVRACADVLAEKPLTTFLIGLLVLLLTGPVVLILTVSFVGIVVVPFALCGLLLAGLVGKVGVARWLGQTIVPGSAEAGTGASRALAVRSFLIGFAVITVALMIPVLGLVAWSSIGVMSIGAGASAFIAHYRKENPAKPRRVVASSDVAGGAAFQSPAPVVPPMLPADGSPAVDAPSAAPDLGGFPFAPFRDRLAAFLLDVILVAIASALLDLGRNGPGRMLVLLLLYHVAFWTWKGTTVGGIICQLRVVRTTGRPLGFADALVRGLSSIFSLAVLGIGAFWILKDPDRQAWHDKIAGTYVVKVPRHYPI